MIVVDAIVVVYVVELVKTCRSLRSLTVMMVVSRVILKHGRGCVNCVHRWTLETRSDGLLSGGG